MFGSAPRRGDRNVGISPPPVISVECGRGYEVLPPHYDSTNAPCAELDHLVRHCGAQPFCNSFLLLPAD